MRKIGLYLLAFSFFVTPQLFAGRVYYVATDGSDSYNGLYSSYQGGTNGPFRTLSKAASKVAAGDTVKIRGGVYQEKSTWIVDGTEAKPITITNYNDETVVIDGNNFTIPGSEFDVLIQIYGDWYTVSNLEIRYSSGNALAAAASADHCTFDNIYAHHNWGGGIYISGWYGLIKNCRAYNNSLINEYFRPHKGTWGFGISACRYPQYTTIRNCVAWDNWGEGISTFESYHITIEDCVSYNNQVNFYISDTKYCLFQRNLSYYTPGNMIQSYYTQTAILMGDEKKNPPSSDNIVINNLCLGGERNFATSEMTNCLVANNTFVNASNTQGDDTCNVLFYKASHTNGQFKNNIILQEDNVRIALFDNPTGISFGYNCWSKTPPTSCQGAGDIIVNPLLAKTGPIGAGLLTPEWFKILASSPARDRAQALREVTEDFFKNPRESAPDIGAHEISTQIKTPSGNN